jgi:hypothetical protein
VYVLCEARKLLDKYPPDREPLALRLYCHWALHIDLHGVQTTLPFLQRVEELVQSLLAGSIDICKENRVFREFLYWDTFRHQFRDFLIAYGLPAAICDEEQRWGKFLTQYAGVIQDGSLSCRAANNGLTLVKEVIFNGKPQQHKKPAQFEFSWDIILLDGRTMTVDVKAAAFPTGEPMLIHGIHLH